MPWLKLRRHWKIKPKSADKDWSFFYDCVTGIISDNYEDFHKDLHEDLEDVLEAWDDRGS